MEHQLLVSDSIPVVLLVITYSSWCVLPILVFCFEPGSRCVALAGLTLDT